MATSSGPHASAALPSLETLGPRFAAFAAGLRRPVVFLDCETTGTDPLEDRIIELTLLRLSPPPGGLEPPRTWRIDPTVRIPRESSAVHGITNADLEGCPTFADVAPEIAGVLYGADVAGFNAARFDLRVLQAEYARIGATLDVDERRIIDSQVIYHRREPRTLAAALQFYRGRELEGAHGAEADTIATLEVFAGQLERYGDLPLDVEGLHGASQQGDDKFVDASRRFAWRDGEPTFQFGKYKGKSLRWTASEQGDRRYLQWMLDGNFEDEVKGIVRDALAGRIPVREG